MIKKLRIKFVCINMAFVTLMLIVIFTFVFHSTAARLEQDSLSMLQSVGSAPEELWMADRQDPGVRLPFFAVELNQQGIISVEANGYYDLSDTDEITALTDEVIQSGTSQGTLKEYNLRYSLVRSPNNSVFIIFADMSSEQSALANLRSNCILIGLAAFAAFLIISVLLSGWAVRPIAKAWDQQRQFVADASHELKTPLTVILSNAELMEETVPQAQPYSGNIHTMSEQMKDLVTELLELARADTGTKKADHTRLDLSELTENALLPFEAVFFEEGLTLNAAISPRVFVSGNSSQLSHVTEILLDNARKYADKNTEVLVTLKQTGQKACLLSVTNQGQPMNSEELNNLFKRFYRRDGARGRDGSYGLGLSIAQAVVNSHHGKIWAECEGRKITFYVRLKTA